MESKTERVDLKTELDATLTEKKVLEEAEDLDSDSDSDSNSDSESDEDSNDTPTTSERLRSYYTVPSMGDVSLRDGERALVVRCDLPLPNGGIRGIDRPAPPARVDARPGGEAQQCTQTQCPPRLADQVVDADRYRPPQATTGTGDNRHRRRQAPAMTGTGDDRHRRRQAPATQNPRP